MEKLVSIVLPTYNGANRVQKAILSVISQSYANWELLVIDDGSTDSSKYTIEDLAKKDSRIKCIKNEVNLGIQKTLNKGLRESNGEYIARIDDDDEWIDIDKLKKQVEFLEKNKDYVLVGTGVVVVSEQGKELFRYLLPKTDQEIKNKLLGKNCFAHSSVMFCKDVVMKFGGYSENVKEQHFEDYDLWLKLGTIGKLANLPSYSLRYTIRKGSISYKNRIEVFRKLLSHIEKYKNSYKNYYFILIRVYIRFFLYSIYLKLPIKFSLNRIIKIYKENW